MPPENGVSALRGNHIINSYTLVIAAIPHGGVYETTSVGVETCEPFQGPTAFVWRLNKITGAIAACDGFQCAPAYWPEDEIYVDEDGGASPDRAHRRFNSSALAYGDSGVVSYRPDGGGLRHAGCRHRVTTLW